MGSALFPGFGHHLFSRQSERGTRARAGGTDRSSNFLVRSGNGNNFEAVGFHIPSSSGLNGVHLTEAEGRSSAPYFRREPSTKSHPEFKHIGK